MRNYYDLLELGPTASVEDIKRAFRQQIARYHPDKVHHLGREFQELAAVRAAELTEAYRILADEDRRAEYDRARSVPGAPAVAPAQSPAADREKAPPAAAERAASPPQVDPELPRVQLKQERASVDHVVRKATIGRFRQALSAVGAYDESELHGFDIACVPKATLFGRSRGPRVLGRVVARVDAESVADAWAQAGKWEPSAEVCIFLMGSGMAAAAELAGAIAIQRRKTRAVKVTLIPIDARNWEAHVPTDAPPVAKNVLAQLRRA